MYISWVLIMTLVFQSGAYNATAASTAVHSVPDFHSQKECLAAGKAWASGVNAQKTRIDATYVCVQRTIDLPAADQF